jgi:hypothetical protein
MTEPFRRQQKAAAESAKANGAAGREEGGGRDANTQKCRDRPQAFRAR